MKRLLESHKIVLRKLIRMNPETQRRNVKKRLRNTMDKMKRSKICTESGRRDGVITIF